MKASGILLLYILAVLSLLVGCKASQNTSKEVQRDYTGDWQRLSLQIDSLRAGFKLSQRQVTDKLSNLKVEHTTTYYTLPDSTGKQYPVYISTTKADKDEQTTERIYTELNATIQRLEQQMKDLSARVNEALKQEQKVAEVSWWDLHKWQVLAPVVLAIIIAAFVYKIRKI